MKKKIFSVIGLLLLVVIMVGIVYFAEQKQQENNIFNKDFGSYEVPYNWVESRALSSSNKYFYVLKGQEKESKPNNISVNRGTNKYAEEDHEIFRKAILAQLSAQVGSRDDVEINANGSTTLNGYILYTFIIKEVEEDIVTTQYYIVGDYEYVLVHETVFEESEETDAVAKTIVDSFKWN